MEIRKRFSWRFDPRVVFTAFTVLLTIVYVVVGIAPAEAANYEISTTLSIPAIGLESEVARMGVEGNRLNVPATIVGEFSENENKTLLIGHATTVFTRLWKVPLGAKIKYNDKVYKVYKIEKLKKSEISMNAVLAPAEKDTIIIMTCAGTLYDSGDASHRLMISAAAE